MNRATVSEVKAALEDVIRRTGTVTLLDVDRISNGTNWPEAEVRKLALTLPLPAKAPEGASDGLRSLIEAAEQFQAEEQAHGAMEPDGYGGQRERDEWRKAQWRLMEAARKLPPRGER